GEGGVWAAAGQEETVLLVDLCEVERRRLLALLQRAEALRRGRLRHVHRPVDQPGNGRFSRRGYRVLGLQALLLQEAARHGGNERRIERRETGELDADLLGHGLLPRACGCCLA